MVAAGHDPVLPDALAFASALPCLLDHPLSLEASLSVKLVRNHWRFLGLVARGMWESKDTSSQS